MPPLYIHDTLPCSSVPKSDLNRAVFLFLRFELIDERSEARGHGRRDSVVLILEALPNCRQRNASIASGIQLALRGMRSVTTLNDPSSDPVVDPVGCSNRGGKIGDQHRPILHQPGRAARAAGGSLRGAHDLPVSRVRRGRRLGKLRRQRQPTPRASISFMTDYPRESNDTPSEKAFCRVAPSVLLSDFAILAAGVF